MNKEKAKGWIAGATAGAAVMVFTSGWWHDHPSAEPVIVRQVVEVPASTITSTTTTTTTTVAPKPADGRSKLIRKIDELSPGASHRYSSAQLEAAGKYACRNWNEPSASRFSVIRNIRENTDVADLQVAGAVAEAVVWTICWETVSFPNGPLEYR